MSAAAGLAVLRAASTMDPDDPELARMEAELKVGGLGKIGPCEKLWLWTFGLRLSSGLTLLDWVGPGSESS